jgi:acetylserotonin N-methyltransferase
MALPDPAPVIQLIDAFRASKTMFAAVSLGVFDRLQRGPATAAALAAALGAHQDALERLLDGCAALGLLRKAGGVYANQPMADAYLCSASPHTLRGYIRYSDQALYPLWAHLDDAVHEGTPRWTQTFGGEGDIFQHFFRTDAAMRDFLLGMHGFGMLTSPAIAAAFDLARFRTLADLGGATGHLAIAAAERYPDLRAIVFDLPRVAPFAREQAAASAAAERIEVKEGDFFEDELPAADLYALGRVLHDWPEPKIARLLDRIFHRLPPGGALLIAERLLEDDGAGPLAVNLQSLNMLICTEGRERTPADYARLLRAAGFTEIEHRRTGLTLDAVLALKPLEP